MKALVETHAPVTEICAIVGFNSLQVFNKAFKQKFQCTPSEYRSRFRAPAGLAEVVETVEVVETAEVAAVDE